jgi:hypothetical protein
MDEDDKDIFNPKTVAKPVTTKPATDKSAFKVNQESSSSAASNKPTDAFGFGRSEPPDDDIFEDKSSSTAANKPTTSAINLSLTSENLFDEDIFQVKPKPPKTTKATNKANNEESIFDDPLSF